MKCTCERSLEVPFNVLKSDSDCPWHNYLEQGRKKDGIPQGKDMNKCSCELKEGDTCYLNSDGRIVCPKCNLPIRSQLELEKEEQNGGKE